MEYALLIEWLLICLVAIVAYLAGEYHGRRRAESEYLDQVQKLSRDVERACINVDHIIAAAMRSDYEEVCGRG